MAKHYELTMEAWWTEIEAALRDYYADGVEITYVGSDGIVFRMPNFCELYMQIQIAVNGSSQASAYAKLSVSSAISADTGKLTNATVISNTTGYPSSDLTTINLVLADSFILIQSGTSVGAVGATTTLIAKCSNGRCLFVTGGALQNDVHRYKYCMFADALTHTPIRFLSPTSLIVKSAKKEVLVPSYFANYPEMELNSDGSFAYIPGLYLTTRTSIISPIVGANYYIGVSPITSNVTNGTYCQNSFFVELETEA